MTMKNIVKALDYDPKTGLIADYLWKDLNDGMKYYNTIKDEVRKKQIELVRLEELLERLKIQTDTTSVIEKINKIKEEIEQSKKVIEMDEMKIDILKNMIFTRKHDLVLQKQRYLIVFGKVPKIENGIIKNLDELLDINKQLQSQTVTIIIS